MRSKEFYPFIRGKPNPLIHKTFKEQLVHPRKTETCRAQDIYGDSLPRGKPLWETSILKGREYFKDRKSVKAEIFVNEWPVKMKDHLPRGKPLGLKNCSRSRDIRAGLVKSFLKRFKADMPDTREIFRKGGIITYLLT